MADRLLAEPYRLEAEIGRGGIASVYGAHDTLLDRSVAVKVVSEAATLRSEGRARLLRQAQWTARLNHPNIVSVDDAGEVDGSPFIVMELVEGESLRILIKDVALIPLTYGRRHLLVKPWAQNFSISESTRGCVERW
ncbi:MAG TPA: protein kinase [Anaerolineae bacterium]|nr:protein kinase [Anaerolineae bacterium]